MKASQLILSILLWTASTLNTNFVSATGRGAVQYQKQTDYGTYKFGYDTGDQGAHSFRQEHRGFDGIVRGRYGYTDADGKLRYVEYEAGPFGYRVKGDTGVEPSQVKIKEGYKAPSDKDLTDLPAALEKIAKDQLFGVPVTPYVKGYTHPEHVQPQIKEVPVQQVVVVKGVKGPAPPQQVVLREPPPRPLVVVHEKQPVQVFVPQHPVQHPQKSILVHQPIQQPIQPIIVQQPIQHPPKSILVQQPIQPPPKSIFIEHPNHPKSFKGYVPPIPVQLPVQVQQPIEIRVNPQQPVIFERPVTPYTKGYVVTPAPHHVKVIHRPLPQVFEKQVTPYIKGYVHTHPPLVRVVTQQPYIFQRPVEDHYTKGYVAPTAAPIVRIVPPVQQQYIQVHPTQAPIVRIVPPVQQQYIQVHPTQAPIVRIVPPVQQQYVKSVYQKGYVNTPPPKVIYRVEPPKTAYVQNPPQQVVVVSQPKVFERPVNQYVKGYVNPPKSVQVVVPERQTYTRVQAPCTKCRAQNQKAYFPQSVSRQYIFSRPVQPYVKGYSGSQARSVSSASSAAQERYRRIQQSGSVQRRNDDGNLVWIPAPQQRYRAETGSYEEPPSYAYAPY